ncbi:MAG: PAS domain S-box protein [Methanoregula sp.]|jgi:PAS domain S-box-containing protein
MIERAKILIVEDESIVAEDLKEVLEKKGYIVPGTVSSGEEALEVVSISHPDLILMDISLSGKLDGIETAKRIHEKYNIPVIYLTSYSSEGYIESAKQTDPYGYIVKPFDPPSIATTIEIALHKHAIDTRNRISLETYRFIAEYTSSWEMWLDAAGIPLYVSPSCERITGYKPIEIIENPRLLVDMVFPEDRTIYADQVEGAVCSPNQRDTVNFRIVTRSGDVRWIGHSCVMIRDKQGAVIGKRISNADITDEQEQIQDFALAFQESNERYLLLTETMVDTIIFVYDETNGLEYINRKGASLLGKTPQELLNKKIPDLFESKIAENAARILERFFTTGEPSFIEYSYARSPGDDLFFETWLFSLDQKDKKTGKVWGLMHDISDKKKAEKNLLSSLKEKDVLLKEIHHRVKNNLQQVASLLYLQEIRGNNTDIATALHESRDRIFSMALVHEILIASENLSQINLASYLSRLIQHIEGSYGNLSDGVKVTMSVDPVIALTLDECIPCGLIINELVSNSMKHAFLPGMKGEIFIRVSGSGQMCTLVVGDNGRGIPSSVDTVHTGSLGLQLVTRLVHQLNGSVSVTGDHGTVYTITFPIKLSGSSELS